MNVLEILPWIGVGIFIAMILFGIIGNFLLRRNLAGNAEAPIRTILGYLSLPHAGRFEPAPQRTANSVLGQNGLERAFARPADLQAEIIRLAVAATAKVIGKSLTADERRRLIEELYEAEAVEGGLKSAQK